jgi:hypothetical protein
MSNRKRLLRKISKEILGESGRTTSDADREVVRRALMDESGRTISDADRERIMQGPGRVHQRGRASQSGRTTSDADRARLLESYINRNDGGIAKKTRNF